MPLEGNLEGAVAKFPCERTPSGLLRPLLGCHGRKPTNSAQWTHQSSLPTVSRQKQDLREYKLSTLCNVQRVILRWQSPCLRTEIEYKINDSDRHCHIIQVAIVNVKFHTPTVPDWVPASVPASWPPSLCDVRACSSRSFGLFLTTDACAHARSESESL